MTTRREFLQQAAVGSLAVSAALGDDPKAAPTEMPKIKLGDLEVSRLILGSNPFFGFSHYSGELDREMVEYYTDEHIWQILDDAAQHGITAVAAPPYERWINAFRRYREQGGKLSHWIAQPDPALPEVADAIRAAVDGGASAVFVQGARTEEAHQAGRMDLIARWVKLMRDRGVPAGLAAHRRDVHVAVEREKLPTDFYFQCFYIPDGKWAETDPAEAIEAIRQIAKPVIGYKILAAGRRPAEEAFRFALGNLRPSDGVCVGMFPKHDAEQLATNVKLTLRYSDTSRA